MNILRHMALAVSVLAVLLQVSSSACADVDFHRDVQPVLAEHCWHCHGGDAEDRKGGLRLDRFEEAVKGGESGSPAIVPGNPDQSELIRRIVSHDADVVMPPPDQKKPVSELQLQILKQWIQEGAEYKKTLGVYSATEGGCS